MTVPQSLVLFVPEMLLTLLALLALIGGTVRKMDPRVLIRFSILGCFLILCALFSLWPGTGTALYGAFEINPFVLFLKVLFTGTGIVTFLISQEYLKTLENRSADFIAIILVALLGCFFLASSTDLITLFITIEWLTISLYILTSYLRTDKYSLEAGTKYLIMGAFSSAVFLYGISFVYGTIGSLRFDQIADILSNAKPDPLFFVGLLLVFVGIGFKISAFPFQLWVPDVYQGAPTPVTAFLSVGSKTAGFAALLKVFFLTINPNQMNWPLLFSLLSAATLLYGNLGALGQTNMKRLFAYSSIGHAGYLLMGVATGTRIGFEATLFYLAAYAISNLTAFLVITIANRELKSGEIASYRGLAKKAPFLAGIFFIALLSLAGIPPLAGFFGKFLVLQAAVAQNYLWLALLGAVNVIISLYYYLTVIKEMYFKQAGSDEKIVLSKTAQISLFLLVLFIIGMGVFQEPILALVQTAAF